MLKEDLKKSLVRLPNYHSFDVLSGLVLFWVAHKRLPRKENGLFNDFLFFLKNSELMYSPLRQLISDKELVKNFYRGRLLEDLAPKTLRIFRSYDEFTNADLPAPCIIKPTHLSGAIFLSADRRGLSDGELARIESWFSTNLYRDVSRERNYRFLESRVICEQVVAEPDEVKDYKFYCFNGVPRAIDVHTDRHRMHKQRIYTASWEPLSIRYDNGDAPLAEIEPEPPELADALAVAATLSEGFTFIRVDMYFSEGRIYLGEMTSVPSNAHGRFDCQESERAFMHLLETGEYE